MLNLRSQRRMAAEVLGVGEGRVWIDPERLEDVEAAITREDIRRLIHEGAIRKLKEKGVSRARARILHEKRKKGRRRGAGSRSGSKKARAKLKKVWVMKVRALRRRLRELKEKRVITTRVYRQLYLKTKSGVFRSISDLHRYIEVHGLRRKR
ncbi:MAG TPA: 50S ribosomal protein L19e [Candidatus Bathyarchaeota archaeon]|nr:50S ribosomal protein L19e [Candidatus Bathyarchaeota archaeon]